MNSGLDRNNFTPRVVLAINLRALMASGRGPRSQNGLREKAGVAQATIGRILSARGENARIETVERLARAYGLEGWQLMIPGMDPANPPVLQPITKEERALYDRLKAVAKDLHKLP